ncbi:hypothetical protein SASPL_140541 [Salvia splendens]|uniref:Uncharacterized protein n=1 Tax=Salvia splendens TaxID=180675 RepID=A0A8X8WQ57_SALSN|nr:hypothetical protein SASPL_140541 [Salvia splendens]
MGFEEKMVDEEFCYEIELIPGCHSSSLDQESDAHQEKNDSSNWMGSFLEEADDSKSSLVDDNNHDKATFDDDEFTKMECHSVKMSDDSDLLWDVVGVTDSSSSCVDNCSQHKCLDSDDDYEDDRVDGDERRSYNLTAAEFQLVRVLVQRFMEDKQFGGRRNDAGVRSRCIIRSLLQVPAIEDDFVKTKAREERDGVEILVGVISEMMRLFHLSLVLVIMVTTYFSNNARGLESYSMSALQPSMQVSVSMFVPENILLTQNYIGQQINGVMIESEPDDGFVFGAETNVIGEASFSPLISGDPMLEQETNSFGQIPHDSC